MEEVANGMSQGQDTPASEPARASDGRLFTQAELNDIVGTAKHKAVESYKRSNEQVAQNANVSQDDVRRLAAEEAGKFLKDAQEKARQQYEEDNNRKIANDFLTKIATGKEKYSDYDDVAGDVELARFPNAVVLANGYVDNTVDVMYVLGQDRIKLSNLEYLAQTSPRDAVKAIQRLSQSIKDNQNSQMKLPKEPLSQPRPSNVGTDNGVMAVRDYRKKYKV